MKKQKIRLKYSTKESITGLLFVLPWILGFLLFFARPMTQSLLYTFQRIELTPEGAVTSFYRPLGGRLQNLENAIKDAEGWNSNNAIIEFGDEVVTLKTEGESEVGMVTYPLGLRYANERFEFTILLEEIGAGNELFAFAIRHTSGEEFVWDSLTDAYMIWVEQDEMQAIKYEQGESEIILDGISSLNEPGYEYVVSYGAVTEGGDTTITLEIDGNVVYEWIDQGSAFEAMDSYFALYVMQDNVVTLGLPDPDRKEFIGFGNYIQAFTRDVNYVRNLTGVLRNMIYEVPIIIFFSIYIALLLNGKFKGRFFVRAIFFLPVILTAGVVMEVLREDVFGGGLGNARVGELFQGVAITELMIRANINYSFIEFYAEVVERIFALTWRSGVQILLFLAALQTIPKSFYEASTIEGATNWENFWKITIPVISPVILLNIVFTIIDSFTDYSNVIMRQIHNTAFVEFRYAYSSTIAWIFFIVIFFVLSLIFMFIGRRVYYSEE